MQRRRRRKNCAAGADKVGVLRSGLGQKGGVYILCAVVFIHQSDSSYRVTHLQAYALILISERGRGIDIELIITPNLEFA